MPSRPETPVEERRSIIPRTSSPAVHGFHTIGRNWRSARTPVAHADGKTARSNRDSFPGYRFASFRFVLRLPSGEMSEGEYEGEREGRRGISVFFGCNAHQNPHRMRTECTPIRTTITPDRSRQDRSVRRRPVVSTALRASMTSTSGSRTSPQGGGSQAARSGR